MGEQNLMQDLLVGLAVIIYFGGMAVKVLKDNKKKKPSTIVKQPKSIKVEPQPAPAAEVAAPLSFEKEGVSDIVSEKAEPVVVKGFEATYSPRQRALRRAVLWSEILKRKF